MAAGTRIEPGSDTTASIWQLRVTSRSVAESLSVLASRLTILTFPKTGMEPFLQVTAFKEVSVLTKVGELIMLNFMALEFEDFETWDFGDLGLFMM